MDSNFTRGKASQVSGPLLSLQLILLGQLPEPFTLTECKYMIHPMSMGCHVWDKAPIPLSFSSFSRAAATASAAAEV